MDADPGAGAHETDQRRDRRAHWLTLNKLVGRDRRTAITFRSDAMTVEVTDYPGWERFRTIIHAMVAARQDVAAVDGCTRIGLRYINEVRVPLDDDAGLVSVGH